jgi:hypothetical protein
MRFAPNPHGSMRRQIQPNAAVVIFGAATKLDTGKEPVPVLSQRSSGRSVGSTTVSRAVNMNGAEVRLAATWSLDERGMSG